MSKVKAVLYCLIGLMVGGIGYGLISHHRIREEPKALLSVLPKKTDVVLNHIHHVATRDGIKEWTLDAKSAEYQKADNKTMFKDIFATFFLKHGKIVNLNSCDGALQTDTQNMEVWGDVVVRSGPYELNTDKLRYEHKAKTISTETPVLIKGDRMEITGNSMVFNLETEQVVVWGEVKAVFERCTLYSAVRFCRYFSMNRLCYTKLAFLIMLLVFGYPAVSVLAESQVTEAKKEGEAESAIRITSDRLESDHKMKWVEFIGNVRATQDDVVITADRMKIFIKSGANTSMSAGTIDKIISRGNVKMVFDNGTKTAVADKSVYLADQKVLELSGGDPTVWSGNNMVRGKRIVLFQAENRTVVEGAGEDQVEATLYVKKGGGFKK